MKLHMIDPITGMYLRDVEVGEMAEAEARALDPALILDPIPEGIEAPRWDGAKWVEGTLDEPLANEGDDLPDELTARVLATEAALIELAAIIGGE